MRILLIDPTACFLDFALRAEAQGHEVRWFIGPDKLQDGGRNVVGDGLIKKIGSWESSMRWADLILNSDNAKYTYHLETWRRQGYPLFCSNRECTAWELDRLLGQKVLQQAGIATLSTVEFSSYRDAMQYQLAHLNKRFVAKPSADVSKALSYVSKGAEDMLFMLEHWQRTQPKTKFVFQEFFPGVEMAVGGWCGRNGFSQWFLENFEFKKFMNDDKGCNTGEQGTVMRYLKAEDSVLAQKVLLPLEMELVRQGYMGYVDVAVMIGEDGTIAPLEFTCRHGWPLFQIQQALHPDTAGWMKSLLEGWDLFEPVQDIAVGVVVTMPNFPFSETLKRSEVTGFPVWGITPENRFNIHPAEMMLGEGYNEKGKKEPMLVTAGDYVLVASGTGKIVRSAQDRCYGVIDELKIPNSPMYRTDIGNRLEKQLPLLKKHGFATGWEW